MTGLTDYERGFNAGLHTALGIIMAEHGGPIPPVLARALARARTQEKKPAAVVHFRVESLGRVG